MTEIACACSPFCSSERVIAARCALSGEQALAIAQSQPISLFSLDLTLPDLDGLEVCRRLRQQTDYRQTPIFLLSANISDAQWRKGIAAGANASFNKATELPRWLLAVREMLASRAAATPDLHPAPAGQSRRATKAARRAPRRPAAAPP